MTGYRVTRSAGGWRLEIAGLVSDFATAAQAYTFLREVSCAA